MTFFPGAFMKVTTRSLVQLATICGTLALTGCASISGVPAGTSYSEVVKEFGNPQATCPLPDGRTRVIWSQQPSGEQVWVTTVGSDQRVGPFQQMMVANMFEPLGQGQWDAAKVRCQYGPPARVQTFPDHPNRVVWEYRFIGGADNQFEMLYVSFDRATHQMINYSTGPDPEYNLLMNGR